MNPAVTIVLPVHNAEGTLRSLVTRILDLAAAPKRRLTVALVDNGSTDETYELACEIARDFPQVRVFRQPFQGGLGPALDDIRHRLQIEEAIIHDGVGPIDLDELAALLRGEGEPAAAAESTASDAAVPAGRGSRRFAAVTALNARLAEAHRGVSSFHWMRLADAAPRRRAAVLTQLAPVSFGGDVPISLA